MATSISRAAWLLALATGTTAPWTVGAQTLPLLDQATIRAPLMAGAVCAADLDDVAQEVFLRLMRYPRSELVEHPQAYLFRMAANVAAERALRARHSRPHESEWLDDLTADDRPQDNVA